MGDLELPIIQDIWTSMGYREGMGGSRKTGPAVKELMACLIQLPGQGLKLAVVGMGMKPDGLLQPSRAPSLATPSRRGGHGSEEAQFHLPKGPASQGQGRGREAGGLRAPDQSFGQVVGPQRPWCPQR